MRHFPAFLNLKDRAAFVLGSGDAVEIKAGLLARAGAVLHRAPRFGRDGQAGDLPEGCAIAIGSGAPDEDLEALFHACQERGVPVNIVDRPALSSFIMPSIIDRAPVTIGISTGGAAPVLARLLRARIESMLPPALGRLAALAERFRELLRSTIPSPPARRRFLDAVLTGPVADLVLAGREVEAEAAFSTALSKADRAPPGIVHLVGAGPGAGDLLTLRALRLLGEADVIVHDRLVGNEVLELARRDAERIYVGKQRARHCLPQEGINELLINLARQGKRVVRLKGGDPFIFGRGGEELEACRKAGVACEVVPGVTAALACAASAGIPLTHRDHARIVTFVTGHTKDGRLDLDFAALSRPEQTLAVYMGVSTLRKLRHGLVAEGLDPMTPVALIESGGTDGQRVLLGTLDGIAEKAAQWHQGGPVMTLVGTVVAGWSPSLTSSRAPVVGSFGL
ncbi:uroporphyrinogen-III C-methyltransferase [Roseomonas sp. SSH11]|uniref:Uroporphyrinogen-III C-methyltransferase n=1 Tax=Pararoseomonas baculiformis TaxID=2820812 RepID=A0ABS4AN23_9PROT|nr:siroheme synthase CysG [Pararoseomonas baculiformis]MBP0447639.1 uroporphyrinogen-III C-methyltransferase [Pararoseomonas baculiformis]